MLISDHHQPPHTPHAHAHAGPSQQQQKQKLPPHSTRILLILNNCSHMREASLQNILSTLTRLGYPDMAGAVSRAAEGIRVSRE